MKAIFLNLSYMGPYSLKNGMQIEKTNANLKKDVLDTQIMTMKMLTQS